MIVHSLLFHAHVGTHYLHRIKQFIFLVSENLTFNFLHFKHKKKEQNLVIAVKWFWCVEDKEIKQMLLEGVRLVACCADKLNKRKFFSMLWIRKYMVIVTHSVTNHVLKFSFWIFKNIEAGFDEPTCICNVTNDPSS